MSTQLWRRAFASFVMIFFRDNRQASLNPDTYSMIQSVPEISRRFPTQIPQSFHVQEEYPSSSPGSSSLPPPSTLQSLCCRFPIRSGMTGVASSRPRRSCRPPGYSCKIICILAALLALTPASQSATNDSYSYRDPKFVYTPKDKWQLNDAAANIAYTNHTGAKMTFSFFGKSTRDFCMRRNLYLVDPTLPRAF